MCPYLGRACPSSLSGSAGSSRPSLRGAPGIYPLSQGPITNQYHCSRVYLGLREEFRPLILRSWQEQLPCFHSGGYTLAGHLGPKERSQHCKAGLLGPALLILIASLATAPNWGLDSTSFAMLSWVPF